MKVYLDTVGCRLNQSEINHSVLLGEIANHPDSILIGE